MWGVWRRWRERVASKHMRPADSANSPIVPAATLDPKQVKTQASGRPLVPEYRH